MDFLVSTKSQKVSMFAFLGFFSLPQDWGMKMGKEGLGENKGNIGFQFNKG